jgi:hypothetical protein
MVVWYKSHSLVSFLVHLANVGWQFMQLFLLCRVSYGVEGFGAVSQQLYSVLTKLQMGLIEDKMNWTVELS